jgi:hypothetical protein
LAKYGRGSPPSDDLFPAAAGLHRYFFYKELV